MVLDESDEKLTALEHEGFTFQFEERIKQIVDSIIIDFTENFWQKGLTIRTSAGGSC